MFPRGTLDRLVIIVRDSDEDTKVSPPLKIEHEAGILDRLPGFLQEQSLLGVHVGRFPWRDSEKLRVNLIDSLQKASAPRAHFARELRVRIIALSDSPAGRLHLT